ncbi:MAG: DGQHR domain-containing protein [Ruminococcaceae bacterium]|nr:DGQHR domain-containing protein [Oscillospiraceae bacterium]
MLKYQFPAVKGKQAGKEYYICMIPLGLLSKIFIIENGDVAPEHRAQRKLNESRIPEISNYILENRESYVFSALAASVDGEMHFVPYNSNSNIGVLEIDMGASFLINDGQHRKAAIDAAIEEDETLKDETISVVLYKDNGLTRSQQMFTDLNKHAVTTSKSFRL